MPATNACILAYRFGVTGPQPLESFRRLAGNCPSARRPCDIQFDVFLLLLGEGCGLLLPQFQRKELALPRASKVSDE